MRLDTRRGPRRSSWIGNCSVEQLPCNTHPLPANYYCFVLSWTPPCTPCCRSLTRKAPANQSGNYRPSLTWSLSMKRVSLQCVWARCWIWSLSLRRRLMGCLRSFEGPWRKLGVPPRSFWTSSTGQPRLSFESRALNFLHLGCWGPFVRSCRSP